MATKSIGSSSRDCATFALHASYMDGLNALSAAEVGEAYNDSAFDVSGGVANYTGFTPSVSFPFTLRCATGQSFRDHANKLTNALAYNQSNGVGLRNTASGYGTVLTGSAPFTTIDGLQISAVNAQARGLTWSGASSVIQNCIIESTSSGETLGLSGAGSHAINCLLISLRDGGSPGIDFGLAQATSFCTIVKPSTATAGARGFSGLYASAVMTAKSCAVFQYTADFGTSNAASINAETCATSDTTPSTGFTGSLTYADQFEVVTATGRDFRAKSGGFLPAAGTAIGGITTDIIGQTRADPPTIGCWELVAGGGGGQTGVIASTIAAVTSSISGTVTHLGTTSATIAAVTAALVGVRTHLGSLGPTIAPVTGEFAGTVTKIGTVSGVISAVIAALSGIVTHPGVLASVIGAVIGSIAGDSGAADTTSGRQPLYRRRRGG